MLCERMCTHNPKKQRAHCESSNGQHKFLFPPTSCESSNVQHQSDASVPTVKVPTASTSQMQAHSL